MRPSLQPTRVLIVTALAGTVALFLGGVFYVASHIAFLPGVGGCRTISSYDARLQCVGRRSADLIRQSGETAGLARIASISAENPRIFTVCHLSMHVAARLVGGAHPQRSLERAMNLPYSCATHGYIHGVLQAAMPTVSGSRVDVLSKLCVKVARSSQAEAVTIARACFHGIGHGLELRLGLRRGLAQCSTMFKTSGGAQDECYMGTFMQDNVDHHGPRTIHESADVLVPCGEFGVGPRAWACYGQVPDRAMRILGIKPEDVVAVCHKIADPINRAPCVYGVGMSNFTDTPVSCGQAQAGEEYRTCVAGFAGIRWQERRKRTARSIGKACSRVPSHRAEDCAGAIGGFIETVAQSGDSDRSHMTCARWFSDRMLASCEHGRASANEGPEYVRPI